MFGEIGSHLAEHFFVSLWHIFSLSLLLYVMGIVHSEITLENATDAEIATRGIIQEHEVRRVTVTAVVDTGAWTLAIN
jgi:hypothetical protein